MNRNVLLGMSGGIDSSIAAIRLLEQGYRVSGVTFLFYGKNESLEESAADAKELAVMLGISHNVVDLRSEFDRFVVQYFKKSYLKGLTPFPCAICNPQLKFAQLVAIANQLKCEYIATGHYVQITENQGYKYISVGVDPEKDQSFFLWGLEKKIINRLLVPLGSFYKEEVRQLASDYSFHSLTKKKESLGICFINGSDYRKYLAETDVNSQPGHFIDSAGNILGQHNGILHYTIGQRKGLNLQNNKRLFVNQIRPESNEIVLGDFKEMYRSRIYLYNTHFINAAQMDSNRIYRVRIRYRLQENACRVMFHGKQEAVVELIEPVAMVAPGQTAVIYENSRVLGGGFIDRSE